MMTPGFLTITVDVRTSDGLDDTLMSPVDFLCRDGRTLRAPVGGTTDGLSVPRVVQNVIPATGGDWMSGVLHDSAYRNQLLLWNPDTQLWVAAGLCQKAADDLLLEALESQGVGWAMRQTIYRALRMFGSKAFNEDRSKPATP